VLGRQDTVHKPDAITASDARNMLACTTQDELEHYSGYGYRVHSSSGNTKAGILLCYTLASA
jgi:hypothetical protein